MVEIKRDSSSLSTSKRREIQEDGAEDSKHRLLYSKSRVYVHPTAYTRDNIPGFVALVKREATAPTYLLAWIPESLLDGRADWDKFVKVEKVTADHDEDIDGVLIEPPAPHGQSYAFSVPLTSVYSLIVMPPSLSSWYGSITINLVSGSTLPTLYYHDDESRSLERDQRVSPNSPSWGGEALLQRLRSYAHLLRSNLQQGLFLVDPSRADIEAHTTQLFDDDAVDLIFSHSASSSPIPPLRRPYPPSLASQYPPSAPLSTNANSRPSLLHQGLASASSPANGGATQAILSSFSQITRATRHAAQNILSHPLAKPILPHLPDPVKSFANAHGEWSSWVEKGGVGEFESARVYLAKWARVVAEEGERARQFEAYRLPRNAAQGEESSDLGVFELLAANSGLPIPRPTRNPRKPIDVQTWDSWFTADGRPKITFEDFRGEIFRRGLTWEAREKAWPHLLEVVPWNTTHEEREAVWEEKRKIYADVKKEWEDNAELFNREDIVEERHRIDVDCRRTDRTHPLFAMQEGDPTVSTLRLEETGAQSLSNEHVDRLAVILLTYNFYEKELGYVQGMSDLCSPIYVVCGTDEVATFWCFVSVMERMKQNFLRDQSGMKKQLSMLQQLVAIMDPELYRHLEKTDSLNLFFCFRWVLIIFKREFSFDDVLRLWEVLWTDFYTKRFVLFVALAILESHRDVMLRYLVEFDEILKYCNELSMAIELDSTLAQAEVLFLSFSQIIADIDRRRAEQESQDTSAGENTLRRRTGPDVSGKNSTDLAPGSGGERVGEVLPIISDDMRELLAL